MSLCLHDRLLFIAVELLVVAPSHTYIECDQDLELRLFPKTHVHLKTLKKGQELLYFTFFFLWRTVITIEQNLTFLHDGRKA